MRILVTRPKDLCENLCAKIACLGWEPQLFPLMNISSIEDQAAMMEAIKILDTANIAIFISQSAVKYGMKAIQSCWPKLPKLQWLAIGPSTKQALLDYGIQDVQIPSEAPFESESLLKLPALQQASVTQKTIFIFRGNGGRNLLLETLQQRGAKLKVIETYQRTLPRIAVKQQIKIWQEHPLDAIIITSKESLKNLSSLVGSQNWRWISEIPMIVVGLRLLTLATTMGIKKPLLASGADDTSLLHALMHLEKQNA